MESQPPPAENTTVDSSLRAFHVLWSLPAVKDGSQLELAREDLLLTVLSALQWRALNGPITLYGDSLAIATLDELGILDVWNDHNTEVLDAIDPSKINPALFWSAGKFFALRHEATPIVMLDTDLVVWRNLDSSVRDFDVRFTHWESVKVSPWYVRRKDLRRPAGYRFRRAWHWDGVMAANTAITYFGDSSRKNDYADSAIEYMTENGLPLESSGIITPEMLFAEQRLLAMHAGALRLRAQPFLNAVWEPSISWFSKHDESYGPWLFFQINDQPWFTHCWLYKYHLRNNAYERQAYCAALARQIAANFPTSFDRLMRLGLLGR